MLIILGNAEAAVACGIDGIPSMSLNGRLVTINTDQATKQNLAYWAPFVTASAERAATLRFAEDARELHKSLTPQAFATPFQWSFGDGSTARGIAAVHHYGRPGWYKVNVSYYYTPEKRWVVFDSAQLHIPGAAGSALLSLPLILVAACTALGLAAFGLVGWRARGAGAQAGDRYPTPRSRHAGRSRGR